MQVAALPLRPQLGHLRGVRPPAHVPLRALQPHHPQPHPAVRGEQRECVGAVDVREASGPAHVIMSCPPPPPSPHHTMGHNQRTHLDRAGYVGEGRKAMLTLKNEILDPVLLRRTKVRESPPASEPASQGLVFVLVWPCTLAPTDTHNHRHRLPISPSSQDTRAESLV